ncbi:MAG: extracellular solute-binding protein [Deltaproteobacteria bacterium]|nr:MAG: extracellular solute-binding protein [Deltaproteobacteria bacterium]
MRTLPHSLLLLLAVLVLGAGGCGAPADEPLELWHAYRGAEAEALREVVRAWEVAHPGRAVRMVAIPHDVYSTKLTSGVPRGNGPDVFIAAHERAGDWARAGILRPFEVSEAARARAEGALIDRSAAMIAGPTVAAQPGPGALDASLFTASHRAALELDGVSWGVPLAAKTVALWVRPDLLEAQGGQVPETTDALVAEAARFSDRRAGRFGLAYEAGNLYFHAAWMHGFGGGLFPDPDGPPRMDTPQNVASLAFLADLQHGEAAMPADATGALVLDLFASGRALFTVSGPWFLSDLGDGVPWRVVPLPRVSATGEPARPYVTVEAAFVTSQVSEARLGEAAALVAFLAGEESSRLRARIGRQVVSREDVLASAEFADDPFLQAFAAAAAAGIPMPNRPEMNTLWEPGNAALRQVLRGSATPEEALAAAQRRVDRLLAPPPEAANGRPWAIAFGALLLLAALLATRHALRTNLAGRMKASRTAYAYVAPAILGAVLLIFIPFAVGAFISLYAHHHGEFTFVGLANFIRILGTHEYAITDPYSFWFTLGVTVLWTGLNVFLHVAIGLALALVLREPWLRLRGLWRVLLIVPWAVPNYITALIWRGMFHVEFGSINALLALFGVEPVDWFSRFATAFAANLSTNVWLGFPFMMVVCLGALQSIPRDLEEAAAVDGASRWQVFRHVTLPLLMPALLPAVILGTVWTFNMFNIIYLVSGGEPDGSTEILISEAYRWAFSRQYQYGYAAAYGVLIFGVLLLWGRLTTRIQRRLA